MPPVHFCVSILCKWLQAERLDSMSDFNNLSLSKALKDGRLQDFIAQAEASGIGPANENDVMKALATTIKPHQSEDQTSRSACGDDLSEK